MVSDGPGGAAELGKNNHFSSPYRDALGTQNKPPAPTYIDF